jgi:hypothetical protein
MRNDAPSALAVLFEPFFQLRRGNDISPTTSNRGISNLDQSKNGKLVEQVSHRRWAETRRNKQMTEGLRLIPISYQPGEYLLAERRVDIGQVSSLPVGETSEIAFERRVLSIKSIEHVASR